MTNSYELQKKTDKSNAERRKTCASILSFHDSCSPSLAKGVNCCVVCSADGSAEALSDVEVLHNTGREFTFTTRGYEATFLSGFTN